MIGLASSKLQMVAAVLVSAPFSGVLTHGKCLVTVDAHEINLIVLFVLALLDASAQFGPIRLLHF